MRRRRQFALVRCTVRGTLAERTIPVRTATPRLTMAKKAKRTTHRSSAGKKLYAVRTADGQFHDIQTFERAHRADLAKTSAAEAAGATKAATKAATKKPVAKKTKAASAMTTVKAGTAKKAKKAKK
jgi:hypothetical protein